MTRQDYEKFASMFSIELAISQYDSSAVRVIVNLIRSAAIIFKQDNERFAYDKFYEACGLRIVDYVYPNGNKLPAYGFITPVHGEVIPI